MKKLVILIIAVLTLQQGFAQKDAINNLLNTKTISDYKTMKGNVEKILTTGINYNNLTSTLYNKLKYAYTDLQINFNAFIDMIAVDLTTKDSLTLMKTEPTHFINKYKNKFNSLGKYYHNEFVGVYDEIKYGGTTKAIGGIFIADIGKEIIATLIDVGTKVVKDIIVNKFTKPLKLKTWDEIVTAPPPPENSIDNETINNPVLTTLEGKIEIVYAPKYDSNNTANDMVNMPFIWMDKGNNNVTKLIGTTVKPNRVENNETFYMTGDYFITDSEYPAYTYFQIKVKSDAIYYVFAFNPSKNSIITAYPYDKDWIDNYKMIPKELRITNNENNIHIDDTTSGYITIPGKNVDIYPPKDNYLYTYGTDKYDYFAILVSNSKLDYMSLYKQILAEDGDLNARLNKVLENNSITVNKKFAINTKDNTISFSCESQDKSVLPIIFVIKRK